MRLNPGTLNRRVDLERDHITRDSGAEVKTPLVYASAWANFEFLSGTERWKAQQIDAEVTVRVALRYRTDVLPSDRVIYRGQHYEIKAVIPDEARRETLILDCKG